MPEVRKRVRCDMNAKQKAALLAWARNIEQEVGSLSGWEEVTHEFEVLREAFAEPEPVASHADPMKAAEECQCGTTPEHDMYSQGTDYYVFCPNVECDAQTPNQNQKTLEAAVCVWNAMQRAAKEEGRC